MADKKQYQVCCKVTLDLTMDIKADSEGDAIKIAKEHFDDMYRLDTNGAYHVVKDVSYEFEAGEYD